MTLDLLVALALSTAPLCDQPRLRPLRHASETHLTFVATAETREAGEGLAPFVYASWQTPAVRKPIRGQLVRVSTASGPSAGVLAASGGRALLVPWDHDTGCEPLAWSADPKWIAPGEQAFVAARLRPRDRWAAGIPTFDVSDAWREPYSIERMRLLTTNMPEARDSLMTPSEYGSLYAALPEIGEWQRDPRSAIRPLLAWRERHPALAQKYPARWVVASTERWAAAGQ